MSLITEALRKARREAAETGARQPGPALSSTLPPASGGSRMGLGFVLGGLITMGAAIAGGGLVWWALDHRAPPEPDAALGQGSTRSAAAVVTHPSTPEPSSPPAPAMPSATGTVTVGTATDAALEPTPATLDEPAVPAASTPGAETRRQDGSPPPPADDSPAQRPVTHPPATPAAPRQPDPEPPTAPAARSFVLDAELGYASLHLDYIVFRPGASFAGINDHEVVEGSIIDGFLVETIERDRVTLSDAAGHVILRVR